MILRLSTLRGSCLHLWPHPAPLFWRPTVRACRENAHRSFSTPVEALTDLPVPLNACFALLSAVHGAGCPWWASIVATTVVLRTVLTLPIAAVQEARTRRLAAVRDMVLAWQATVAAKAGRTGRAEAQSFSVFRRLAEKETRTKIAALMRHHRCSPRTTFLLPWVQAPLFVAMSLTLRAMAGAPLPFNIIDPSDPIPGLSDGGVAWLLDLTVPDHSLVLPYIVGMGHFLNIELNALAMPLDAKGRMLKNIFRGIAIISVPVAASIPAAVSLYWATSVVWSLLWNLWRFRARLSLPIAS